MGKLDKTKKAIGVDKIDDKDRKEMFEKFQSAGGKIIKDEEEPPPVVPKQKPSIKTRPATKISQKDYSSQKGGRLGSIDEAEQSKYNQAYANEEMGNFLNRLIIKFKCWANKVTPFGSSSLNPSFLSELNLEFKGALMEFRLAANELLGNPELSPKLVKALDKISPLYVELIGRAGKVYDTTELNELLEDYNTIPENPVPIKKIQTPLYSIFTKLYYLYPFQSKYKQALIAAYDALQRLENKPAMIYNTKKKNSLAAVSIVFDRFFERLYLAIIRNENKNIPMISLYMENLLDIQENEKPGKRKAGEDLPINAGGKPKTEEKTEEVKEEKKPEELEPDLDKGLQMLRETTIETLRKKHDPRGELAEIPDADKCFLAYMYYREFDYEYSIVLTTKRINIQPTTINGNKIDHKAKLLGIYELSRNCMDQFKIYFETFKEFSKLKSSPSSNYIEQSKKLSQLELRRGQHSRSTRAAIKDYIEKSHQALAALLEDIRGPKQIVTNSEELLTFDSVESKKKLHKKPIKDCIYDAYCFTYGLLYRLSEPN
ncbi:MAG: hypothetical protein N3A69_09400, partial [Leptospiraceae bacterium]|nr:hypothetical protein [Leptospiraceae bacterium]